jgi:hypothetical protein
LNEKKATYPVCHSMVKDNHKTGLLGLSDEDHFEWDLATDIHGKRRMIFYIVGHCVDSTVIGTAIINLLKDVFCRNFPVLPAVTKPAFKRRIGPGQSALEFGVPLK